MQAVGLALPELHHLWVQDVATPTRRSRRLGALCIFLTRQPPPPSTPSQSPVKEAAGMHLTRVAREECIWNSKDSMASRKHEGPSVPF